MDAADLATGVQRAEANLMEKHAVRRTDGAEVQMRTAEEDVSLYSVLAVEFRSREHRSRLLLIRDGAVLRLVGRSVISGILVVLGLDGVGGQVSIAVVDVRVHLGHAIDHCH
jgi:hypothetical protein